QIELKDLRTELPLPIVRQIELAQWALIMLRLTFVSDIGYHAQALNHKVAKLANIAEEAAAHVDSLSAAKLLLWVKREGTKRFEAALPEQTYKRLSDKLHKDMDKAS